MDRGSNGGRGIRRPQVSGLGQRPSTRGRGNSLGRGNMGQPIANLDAMEVDDMQFANPPEPPPSEGEEANDEIIEYDEWDMPIPRAPAYAIAGPSRVGPSGSGRPWTAPEASSMIFEQNPWEEHTDNTEPLPAYNASLSNFEKNEVLDRIGKILRRKISIGHGFCIITGPTGSGKSTTCILALLKDVHRQILETNQKIFVCEPRRVAASELYRRFKAVCHPLDLRPDAFGIMTGNENLKENFRKASLVVGTAGWLLTYLIHNPNEIQTFHTVVIDEVHEMSLDIEILMAVLTCLHFVHRQKMRLINQAPSNSMVSTPKPFANIVLVSATMRTNELYNFWRPTAYFAGIGRDRPPIEAITAHMGAGMNTKFEVREMDLNDLSNKFEMDVETALDETKGKYAPALYASVIAVIFDVIEKVLTSQKLEQYKNGVILVHVPGVPEIEQCISYYNTNHSRVSRRLRLIPFHGNLTTEELVSAKTQARLRNHSEILVYLATPIADSSITLENCSVVIDACLIKHIEHDRELNCNMLNRMWADQFVQTQRKGRTGRERNGLYVRCIPKGREIVDIPTELTRAKFDSTYLRILKLSEINFGVAIQGLVTRFIKAFLFSRPSDDTVNETIGRLLNTGIVVRQTEEYNRQFPYDNFVLSHMGRTCSHFQMDHELVKACCFGNVLGCFDTVAIASSFVDEEIRTSLFLPCAPIPLIHFKTRFSLGCPSDTLTEVHLFRTWVKSESTRRTDGLPKLSVPPSAWMAEPSTHRVYGTSTHLELKDEDLTFCRLYIFPLIDDHLQELRQNFDKAELGTRSAKLYKIMYKTVEGRRKARSDTRTLEALSLIMTTNSDHHFLSYPPDNFQAEKYQDLCLINSVILQPLPPQNADVREWGSQLMELISKPTNIYPDIYIDRPNDRVIAVFPPPSQHVHLGMIHPSVKDALLEAYYKKDDYKLDIFYTPPNEKGERDKESIKSSYSATTMRSDPLMKDVKKPSDETGFNEETVFQIVVAMNPHHIGVRQLRRGQEQDMFLQISNDLLSASYNFRSHMTLNQIVLGQQVIYEHLTAPRENVNLWNQRYWRGVIMATIDMDQYKGKSEHVKNQVNVYVDMIDHGLTLAVRCPQLYLFDEERLNYGLETLFTDLPPQGYRLMLETLQPNSLVEWGWSSDALSNMSKKLKENGDTEFKCRCKLDISFSSKIRRIIIAKDIFPSENFNDYKEKLIRKEERRVRGEEPEPPQPRLSFVKWAIDNNYALPLDGVLLDVMSNPMPSETYCPRPRNASTYEDLINRDNYLRNEGRPSEDGIRIPKAHKFTFHTIFSPMEIRMAPINNNNMKIILQPCERSINTKALDHRLANINMSTEIYDPLLIVGKNLRGVVTKDHKILRCPELTIMHPIPGILPLIEMLTYPLVEVLIQKGIPIAVRCFKKSVELGFILDSIIEIRCRLTQQEVRVIGMLRQDINSIYMDEHLNIDIDGFMFTLLELLQVQREAIDPASQFEFRNIRTPNVTLNGYCVPAVQVFNVRDIQVDQMED